VPAWLICLALGPAWAQSGAAPAAAARLRGMEFLRGADTVAARVLTSGPVQGTVRTVTGPPRAFVDLHGLVLDPVPEEKYVGVDGVWHARWSEINPQQHSARLVLDLQAPLPARWVPAPDGGRLEVGPAGGDLSPFTPERPRVEALDLVNDPGQSGQVKVRLSAPAEFSLETTRRPYGFTLVFPDAVGEALSPAPASAVGGGPIIRAAEARPQGEYGVEVAIQPGWVMRPTVETDATGQQITFTLRRDTLAGKTLVIDPGHGGKDSGGRGCGLKEKDITLLVAKALVPQLCEAGALAVLTRDHDVFVPLPDRPAVATALHADVFVSIHCNAGNHPNQSHGTEGYYYSPQSKLLADMLQDSLVAGLGRRDNGVRQRHFAVLWRSPTPSALMELMYIDWNGEGELLGKPETQERAAEALLAGLRAYFEGVELTAEGNWPGAEAHPLPPPLVGAGAESGPAEVTH
jgi:N-acetylmuramoyl-L-alanine amidase